MRLAAIFLLLAGLAGGLPARADQKPVALEQEKQSLEEFAASHPTCREWTDGCLICVRKSDTGFTCSLPGIACQPTKLSCGHKMMAPDTALPPLPPEQEPPKADPQAK